MGKKGQDTPPSKKGGKKTKKKGCLGRIFGCFGWIVFLGVVGVCVICIALCAGRLLLSDAKLRELIVDQGGRALRQDVKLKSARLRLASGLKLEGLSIQDPDAKGEPPLLSLAGLDVAYDLSQAHKRIITVRNIELASPHVSLVQQDGKWNFEALLPPPSKEPKPEPEPKGPPGEPIWAKPFRLPLDVIIKQIKLSDFRLRVKMEDGTQINLDGLNVAITGELSRTKNNVQVAVYTSNVESPFQIDSPIDRAAMNLRVHAKTDKVIQLLSALVVHVNVEQQDFQTLTLNLRLELANTRAKVDKPLPPFDLVCTAKVKVNLPEAKAELEDLRVTIGEKSALALKALVTDFLPKPGKPLEPQVDVRMTQCAFDLGELFGFAQPLVPDGRDMRVSGVFRVPKLAAKGAPTAGGMTVGMAVRLDDVAVDHPAMKAAATGVSASFDVPDVHVGLTRAKDGDGMRVDVAKAQARMGLVVGGATFDTFTIAGLTEKLVLAAADVAHVQGKDTQVVTIGAAGATSDFALQSFAMKDDKLAATASGLTATLTTEAKGIEQQSGKVTVAGVRTRLGVGLDQAGTKLPDMEAHVGKIGISLDASASDIQQSGAKVRVATVALDQGFSVKGVEAKTANPAATATVSPITENVRLRVSDIALDGADVGVGQVRLQQSFGIAGIAARAADPAATATVGPIGQDFALTLDRVALDTPTPVEGQAATPTATIAAADIALTATVGPIAGNAALKDKDGKAQRAVATIAGITKKVRVRGEKIAYRAPDLDVASLKGQTELVVTKIAADAMGSKAIVKAIRQEIAFAGSGKNLRTFTVEKLTLDLVEPTVQSPDFGTFAVPVSVAMNATADVAAMDVEVPRLTLALGDWLKVTVEASAKNAGQDALSAKTNLTLDLGKAMKLVTPEITEKFGEVKAAGSITVAAAADGNLGTKDAPGEIGLKSNVAVRMSGIAYPKMQATIGSLSLDVAAATGYVMDGAVKPVAATIGLSIENVAAMDMATVGSVRLDVDAALPTLDKARAKVEFAVRQAEYHQDDLATRPVDVDLALDAHADLANAIYGAKGLDLRVGDFLTVGLDAKYAVKKQTFDVAMRQELRLAEALKQVPAQFAKSVPPIETNLVQRLTLTAKGSVPTAEQINKLDVPVELNLTFALDGDVALPDMGIAATGLKEALDVGIAGQEVRVKQRFAAKKVTYNDALGDDSLQPELSLDLRLDNLDRLNLAWVTKLPRHAVNVNVTTAASGFRFLIEEQLAQKEKPERELTAEEQKAELMKQAKRVLDQTALDLDLKVNVSDLSKLALVKGLAVGGGLSVDMAAALEPNRSVAASLKLGADGLSLRMDKTTAKGQETVVQVKDMNADIRLARRLELVEATVASAGPSAPLSDTFLGNINTLLATRGRETSRTLYSDLRSYVPQRDNLNIKSVTAGPAQIDDFALDLDFEDGVWIDHLSMTALGGSMTGRVGAGLLGGHYVVALAFEFTGLSGKSMLPFLDKGVPDEDAEISGNFMLAMKLTGSKQVGLDDIFMAFNITKVGSRALDRFLLAQDPTESNPQIVVARKYTRLGRPYRVSIRVVNGEMRQAISVKMAGVPKPIPLPLPESIPLGKIMDLGMFEKPLAALNQVRAALQMLAAKKIEFGKDGSVRFSR